jgi:hypothetical protein
VLLEIAKESILAVGHILARVGRRLVEGQNLTAGMDHLDSTTGKI